MSARKRIMLVNSIFIRGRGSPARMVLAVSAVLHTPDLTTFVTSREMKTIADSWTMVTQNVCLSSSLANIFLCT